MSPDKKLPIVPGTLNHDRGDKCFLSNMIKENLALENEGLEQLSKIANKKNKNEKYPLFKSPYIKPLDRKKRRNLLKRD